MNHIISRSTFLLFFSALALTWFIVSCSDAFKEINGLEELVEEDPEEKEEEYSILKEDEDSILSGTLVDAAVDGVILPQRLNPGSLTVVGGLNILLVKQ